MFTTKNYLWIALPGLVLAGLFGWLFIRDESVPLWFAGVLVVQVILLAWWQRRDMRVVLQGAEGLSADGKPLGWLFWLKRLAVLLLILVLGGVGQSVWLMSGYGFPAGLAAREPLRSLGVYPLPVPERVIVPAGEFQMGSDKYESEQPIHTVKIAGAFEMGKYEVTFDEYDYFVGEMRKAGIQLDNDPDAEKGTDTGTVNYPFPADEGWGRGDRPVINISWYEAQGYVNWLSKETERECRLPSEAEWEYAARAGTTTDYPWSDKVSHEYANYGKDECCEGLVEGRDQWENTAPVGQFPSNQFGLYDMHGNVYEWVQDCWHGNYQQAPVDGSAWEVQCGNELRRVLRGGSWFFSPTILRSAYRHGGSPDYRDGVIGFRVVCSPP